MSNFDKINNDFFCENCKTEVVTRYNPYKHDVEDDDENSDVPETLQTMNNILENCKSYTIGDVNDIPSCDFIENMSSFFLNLDGNQTNFDNMIVELEQFKHKFSIIGIAETNTDPAISKVYQIPIVFIRILNQVRKKVQVLHCIHTHHLMPLSIVTYQKPHQISKHYLSPYPMVIIQ